MGAVHADHQGVGLHRIQGGGHALLGICWRYSYGPGCANKNMTDSLSLQLLEHLRSEIAGIPGVEACYLDRYEPVGENEPKPVVIINSSDSDYTISNNHQMRQESMQIFIEIHAPFSTSTTLSRDHDPWFTAVDAIVTSLAGTFLGVGRSELVRSTVRGESGWLGFLLLTYNLEQVHQQGNRSAIPGCP